jgi:hypothetical protein
MIARHDDRLDAGIPGQSDGLRDVFAERVCESDDRGREPRVRFRGTGEE